MSNRDLTNAQIDSLQIFQEISQIHDSDTCIDILTQNRWDVDLAVESFISGRRTASVPARTGHTDMTQTSRSQPGANSGNQRNNILDVVLNPLRWLFQTHPVSLNPDQDTRNFISDFESKFGSGHPNFFDRSQLAAVNEASQGLKYLLVYIHSPLHENSDRFCRQVLCSQSLSRFINQNMVFWAGSVWDAEGYGLSTQLKASTYPFLSLLLCRSNREVQVADRIQGHIEERELIDRLQNVMGTLNPEVARLQQELNMREQATRLRTEQDREYQETMEADRKAREKKQQEAEQREREEEEARQKAELEDAIQMSEQLAKISAITRIRATLPPEPPADASAAVVRFQLPLGAKVGRRFKKDETVQTVLDFLTLHFEDTGANISRFAVSTNYPKRQLDDSAMTIEEAGLYPRGVLFVNDLNA